MPNEVQVCCGIQSPHPIAGSDGFGDNVHRVMESIHNQAMQGQVPTEEDIPAIVAEKWINRNFVRPDEDKELMSAKQVRRYQIDHGRTLSSVFGAETAVSLDLDGQAVLAPGSPLDPPEPGIAISSLWPIRTGLNSVLCI